MNDESMTRTTSDTSRCEYCGRPAIAQDAFDAPLCERCYETALEVAAAESAAGWNANP